jgi:hypothetical protein
MPLLEDIKSYAERMTGIGMPDKEHVAACIRERKPNLHSFMDRGKTPNNPILPLIYYRSPMALHAKFDPAAIFEVLFLSNGGTTAGAIGSTTFSISTRARMKFLASHVETHMCGLAVNMAARWPSKQEM